MEANEKTGKGINDLKTQLQKQQRELQASEARFRNIIEKNADSIIIVDMKGMVRFVNPAAEALFGRKAGDFLGESFGFPVVTGEAKELAIIRGDGKPATGEMRVVEIEWKGKSAYLTSIRDITDRKRAEEAEAKARANAERIEQLRRELHSLKQLSNPPQTTVTAQMFGMMPLRENVPDIFGELIQRYGDLMEQALEQRAYKVQYNISDDLQAMAEQTGFLKAGPRDVVEIHSTALQRKTRNVTSAKTQAYVEEGRLMLLELMGYLVAFYRNYSLGGMRIYSPEAKMEEKKRNR
jgi:hypothetical protein